MATKKKTKRVKKTTQIQAAAVRPQLTKKEHAVKRLLDVELDKLIADYEGGGAPLFGCRHKHLGEMVKLCHQLRSLKGVPETEA